MNMQFNWVKNASILLFLYYKEKEEEKQIRRLIAI